MRNRGRRKSCCNSPLLFFPLLHLFRTPLGPPPTPLFPLFFKGAQERREKFFLFRFAVVGFARPPKSLPPRTLQWKIRGWAYIRREKAQYCTKCWNKYSSFRLFYCVVTTPQPSYGDGVPKYQRASRPLLPILHSQVSLETLFSRKPPSLPPDRRMRQS